MTDDVVAVEALAFRSWPAEVEVEVAGWMLRHSAGISARRINSATTPTDRCDDPAEAERMVRSWFDDREITPVIRVLSVSDPEIDLHFEAAGWERESPTLTMARRLQPGHAVAAVDIEPTPPEAWVAAKQRLTGMTDEMIDTWLRRASDIKGATGFATLRAGSQVVTIALGVLDGGWLGLFDLNTDPRYRRRGMARAVVDALESWALERATARAYLQVEVANDPAIELYGSAGYDRLYEYWYRRAPRRSR